MTRRKPQLNTTPCHTCGARAGEACYEHGTTRLTTHRQTEYWVAMAQTNASHGEQKP